MINLYENILIDNTINITILFERSLWLNCKILEMKALKIF